MQIFSFNMKKWIAFFIIVWYNPKSDRKLLVWLSR